MTDHPDTIAAPPFAPPPEGAAVLPYLIEMREVADVMHARQTMQLERQGIWFNESDLPAMNALLHAHRDALALPLIADPDEHRAARRRVVADVIAEHARAIAESGEVRGAAPADAYALGETPEPETWANGVTLQASLETALQELDRDAAILALGSLIGNPQPPHQLTGFGGLYSEDEVAGYFGVTVATLRVWRTRRRHFEYLKFPGQRGAVRYTERGMRAFIAAHLSPAA